MAVSSLAGVGATETITPSMLAPIDNVVRQLNAIVDGAVETGDRRGLFAAVYREVTLKVREGIIQGRFENGPRMARFDAIFAQRYLDAFARFDRGQPTSRCWETAFQASSRRLSILQHIVLGINAHINLDLGIAAATVSPGRSLADLKNDFDTINQVLADVAKDVFQKLDQVEPVTRLLGRGTELSFAKFTIGEARNEAWELAQSLAPLDAQKRAPLIDERDEVTNLIARSIADARVFGFVASFTEPSVKKAIEVLERSDQVAAARARA